MMNKLSIKSLIFFIIILITFSLSISADAQLVNDTRVNDDSTNFTQERARLGVFGLNGFIVVWEDYRTNSVGIYMQKFNYNGQRLGNNILLVPSAYSPEMAVRKDGSFGLIFLDTVPKFRLFNNQGSPISNIVNLDVFRNWGTGTNSIACDTNGNFVIAQEIIIATENKNIYYQLIDSLGNKVGEKKRVNDDTTYTGRHQNPVVTKRKDGSFVVAWQDTRPPSIPNGDDIYLQIYDKNGTKIGNNTRVND
ncbi:MAG: hypothetical protein LWX07_07875, partial [Bacteroidetes bacterium]|nr:hypothetical protein [Bacteroidota bacterium]